MNNQISQLVYAAALSSGLFLAACSGEMCSPNDGETSAVVGVDPGISGVSTPSAPDATMTVAIAALQKKQLSSFLKTVLPPTQQDEMRKAWAEAQKEPIKADEDAQFQAFMAMATAEGAEDTLFHMVKPYLSEAQQQMEGMAQMLPMIMAGTMQDANLPQESQAMLGDFAKEVVGIDLASEENARRAVGIFVTTARALKVKSAKQLQALSFDEVMGRADLVYACVVDILGVYGLSPEGMLKSMTARTVSTTGDLAQMELTFSLFGMDPETVPFKMERIEGRWFPKAPEQDGATTDGLAR
jgi:hypothetical protein